MDCHYETSHLSPPSIIDRGRNTTVGPRVQPLLSLIDSISHTVHLGHDWRTSPQTVDAALHHLVHRIIKATGQFVDDISVCYFAEIHTFIPVVSRKHFHDCLIGFGTIPGADFSLLLLSICLITYKGDHSHRPNGYIDNEFLYLSTHSLFAKVQASLLPQYTSFRRDFCWLSMSIRTEDLNMLSYQLQAVHAWPIFPESKNPRLGPWHLWQIACY